MAIGLVAGLRNARNDAITTFVGASGKLQVMSGTRPATGGTATTVLGILTCNATYAPSSSGGVLTLNAITQDSAADSTGTATWFRQFKSDGTTICFDGSVTATGGGGDLELSTVSIVVGGPITVTSFVLTDGNP